jgi:CBS domain-containing protein
MVERDIGRIPVKDKDGKLLGIVDREDIVRLTMK